jgi:hypothetical protein
MHCAPTKEDTTSQAYIKMKKLIHKKCLGNIGAYWRKLRTTFAFRVLLIATRSIVCVITKLGLGAISLKHAVVNFLLVYTDTKVWVCNHLDYQTIHTERGRVLNSGVLIRTLLAPHF